MLDDSLVSTDGSVVFEEGELSSSEQAVVRLAESGDYLESAQAAERLIRSGQVPFRLVGCYLLGLMIERGLDHLPSLMQIATALLGTLDSPASPDAQRSVDGTLSWLLATMHAQLEFHKAGGDGTWKRWLSSRQSTLYKCTASA